MKSKLSSKHHIDRIFHMIDMINIYLQDKSQKQLERIYDQFTLLNITDRSTIISWLENKAKSLEIGIKYIHQNDYQSYWSMAVILCTMDRMLRLSSNNRSWKQMLDIVNTEKTIKHGRRALQRAFDELTPVAKRAMNYIISIHHVPENMKYIYLKEYIVTNNLSSETLSEIIEVIDAMCHRLYYEFEVGGILSCGADASDYSTISYMLYDIIATRPKAPSTDAHKPTKLRLIKGGLNEGVDNNDKK